MCLPIGYGRTCRGALDTQVRLANAIASGLHARMFEMILGGYAAVNVVTFLLYGWDKRAARCGAARIRERTLHLWALAGGAPGAFAGQAVFRHKTRHASFAVVSALGLGLHAAAWAWWWTG